MIVLEIEPDRQLVKTSAPQIVRRDRQQLLTRDPALLRLNM